MTTVDTVLALVRKRVPAYLQHRVTLDAKLDDLDLHPLDRFFSLPTDVEETFILKLFDDKTIEGWATVADIVATVENRE